jgi:hypothetical protein
MPKETAAAFVTLALALPPVVAQETWPEAIEDNSFLIEEAFNQGPRVVQHITAGQRGDLDGQSAELSFTQEWPAPSQRHQLSFTVNQGLGDGQGLGDWGDLLLNYRFQWPVGREHLAVAPRLSLILPADNDFAEVDAAGLGLEVNLPVSYRWSADWIGHFNLGGSYQRGSLRGLAGAPTRSLAAAFAGGSVIWLAQPRLNLLFEAVVEEAEELTPTGGTERFTSTIVSPGLRTAFDRGELQIVPGLALPVQFEDGEQTVGAFVYLSFEHPF